jgi:MinD superfamily P-loop ATPase
MTPRPGTAIRLIVSLEPRRCNGCRQCLPVCDTGALIWVAAERELLTDPWSCNGCGDCVRSCPDGALSLVTVAAA